jgi:hypothetical protein
MEIIGDDKKIRALFSEIRFADEQAGPGFTAVWHRAESRADRPRRAFNLSFVTATALLVFALASLAFWSKLSQQSTPANNVLAALSAGKISDQSPNTIQSTVASTESTAPIKKRLTKLPAVRQGSQKQSVTVATNRQVATQAKEIASWTSPTASLLSSSSDDLFKSLPQLNENASDLKSFLPNSSNKENQK